MYVVMYVCMCVCCDVCVMYVCMYVVMYMCVCVCVVCVASCVRLWIDTPPPLGMPSCCSTSVAVDVVVSCHAQHDVACSCSVPRCGCRFHCHNLHHCRYQSAAATVVVVVDVAVCLLRWWWCWWWCHVILLLCLSLLVTVPGWTD